MSSKTLFAIWAIRKLLNVIHELLLNFSVSVAEFFERSLL